MRIDPALLKAIRKKLNVSRPVAYRRIAEQAARLGERRDVAALEVAALAGMNFQQFASQEQLARLREARASVAGTTTATTPAAVPVRRNAARSGRARTRGPGKHVWIVHGRDDRLRQALFDFVKSIGLEPLEWSAAVRATKHGAPYVGDVLDKAFAKASAVIVLMTPDDDAMLRKKHWQKDEESYEKKLTGQARPNVLFEAGIAFGTHPTQTILVEIGKCRPFSDTVGRLKVKMNDSVAKRKELADRLEAAGCEVDLKGDAWKTAGDFSSPD